MNIKRAAADLLLLLTAFIWGTAFVAQRLGMDSVGPLTFCTSRYFIGGAIVFVVVILSDMRRGMAFASEESLMEWRGALKGGFACGLAMFLGSSAQQIGLLYTGVGKAGFITTLYVVFVPLLGLLLKKHVRPVEWAAVVVSLVGLYLLSVKAGLTIESGDAILLVGSVFWSAHIICCSYFTQTADPLKLSCIQFTVSCLMSFAAMLVFESPTAAALRGAMWPILYVGCLSTGVAFTCQMAGQKYANPVSASLIMSLESIFAALAGYAVLGELLTAREIMGCTLMFAAVLISQLPQRYIIKKYREKFL